MLPSRPNPHTVLFLGLLLSWLFIVGQSIVRIEAIRDLSRAGVAPAGLAAIPGVQTREVPLPFLSIDSDWWVMHTEAMIHAGAWRVRETTRDNAPEGREMHWSSALLWLLAALAWLIHFVSGLGVEESVQHAALLAGPLLLLGFATGFALLAARRWGGRVGAFVALGLTSLAPLDTYFKAGEADHHGIVTCFALGCVVAALAAGAGRVAPLGRGRTPGALIPEARTARLCMMLSGLLGAAGLWVSSVTTVPVLGGIALGALVAAWLERWKPHDEGSVATPALWRWWGAAGAIASLGFYLLEYAPAHFSWRLEVNHPLYALAWLGGGDLLARSCSWLGSGRFAPSWRQRAAALLALAAVLALPLTIKLGGARVFTLQDSFLWNLHVDYIQEFQALLEVLRGQPWRTLAISVPIWPLLFIPAVWLLASRRVPAGASGLFAIALGAALPLSGLALLQLRWFSVAQTLSLAPILVLLCLRREPLFQNAPRWSRITLYGVLAWGLSVFPVMAISTWGQPREISREEAMVLVTRDVAWKLRAARGAQPINVLSGPTTTSMLAFFGDTQGVGTLYWENLEGLKTAGAFYGALDPAEALRICQERRITHVVLFSWDNFAQPYARLHHGRAPEANTEDCFVSALLVTKNIPPWLRPVPYTLLPVLAKDGHWALIFELRPEQTMAEAYYHLGVYLKSINSQAAALDALAQSWRADPSIHETGRELAHALIEAKRPAEAEPVAARLPLPARFEVERAIASRQLFDRNYPAAVAALRRMQNLAPNDREIVTDLAWLLATAEDSAARDGQEALALMSGLARAGQEMTFREIDALAAALAETGDFPAALRLIEQALAVAEKNPAAVEAGWPQALTLRGNSYAASRPFRAAPFSASPPALELPNTQNLKR